MRMKTCKLLIMPFFLGTTNHQSSHWQTKDPHEIARNLRVVCQGTDGKQINYFLWTGSITLSPNLSSFAAPLWGDEFWTSGIRGWQMSLKKSEHKDCILFKSVLCYISIYVLFNFNLGILVFQNWNSGDIQKVQTDKRKTNMLLAFNCLVMVNVFSLFWWNKSDIHIGK